MKASSLVSVLGLNVWRCVAEGGTEVLTAVFPEDGHAFTLERSRGAVVVRGPLAPLIANGDFDRVLAQADVENA